MKMAKMAIPALMVLGPLAWWVSLTDSKKRFYRHLGKQLPLMPLRYFA